MTSFEPYDPTKSTAKKKETLNTINTPLPPKKPFLGTLKTIWPFFIIAMALAFAWYDWKYDEMSGTPLPGILFAVFVFAIWWFFIRGKKRDY